MTGVQPPSCPVCELPPAEFSALHRDYARRLLTVDGVALRYPQLTVAAVRRHFKTHIPPPVGDAAIDTDRDRPRPVGVRDYAAFLDGVVDAEEVLVTTVRRTLRDLARMDVEVAAARSVTDARRALTVGLRTKHALVRQLKELEAARQPRKRLLYVLMKGLEEVTRIAEPRLKTIAQEHLQRVGEAMGEFHRVANWKALKAKLDNAEVRLHDALATVIKEICLDVTGWMEDQLSEAMGWKKRGNTGARRTRASAADLSSFPF